MHCRGLIQYVDVPDSLIRCSDSSLLKFSPPTAAEARVRCRAVTCQSRDLQFRNKGDERVQVSP